MMKRGCAVGWRSCRPLWPSPVRSSGSGPAPGGGTPRRCAGNQLPQFDDAQYAGLDARRKRALYRSRQRGMLENDLLLGSFAAKHLAQFTDAQVQEYERILDEIDPDLLEWITGKVPVPDDYEQSDVMQLLVRHVQSNPLNYSSA